MVTIQPNDNNSLAKHQSDQDRTIDDVRRDLLLRRFRNLQHINVQIDEDHLNLIKSDDEIVVASINTIRTFSNITYERSSELHIEEIIFQNFLIRNASGTL